MTNHKVNFWKWQCRFVDNHNSLTYRSLSIKADDLCDFRLTLGIESDIVPEIGRKQSLETKNYIIHPSKCTDDR